MPLGDPGNHVRMSDALRGTEAEAEAPVNPYSLLGAVNASSDSVHAGLLLFIGILSYLLIAVAGVTHKDLLLSRDISLPVLQVSIGLTRFFLFAPVVLVLFHVGVIAQFVVLARKALELDSALRLIEPTDRRTHPLRLELGNFFFVQAIAGPERSHIVNGLLHGLAWLTLAVLPLLLLLFVQVAFLPYHDETITWVHRAALMADLTLLVLFGVFLSRPEPSFARALWQAGLSRPIVALVSTLALAAITAFSCLVATIPGEPLDGLGLTRASGSVTAEIGSGGAARPFATSIVGYAPDAKVLGLFERNLSVTDHDLVAEKELTRRKPTLNLRGRDLRHARLDRTDLRQADLTGANLDGASFAGADLRGALLGCADIGNLLLADNRRTTGCPTARNASFRKARIGEANLAGLDLRGADLEDADLGGATLAHANLAGANLRGARLERADMSGITAPGINLAAAVLHGADLIGARLQAADLTSAALQGAILDLASLDAAVLRDADLEGASLYRARLPMTNLAGATIRAANFREAWVWQAVPPEPGQGDLADLAGLRTSVPTPTDASPLGAMLQRLADAKLEDRVRGAVGDLLAAAEGRLPERTATPGGGSWADLARSSQQTPLDAVRVAEPTVAPTAAAPMLSNAANSTDPAANPGAAASRVARSGDRRSLLTQHLVALACKSRWANGAVATGLARQALGPAFNGDASLLYEGLRRPECGAARHLPSDLMTRLAGAAETTRGK